MSTIVAEVYGTNYDEQVRIANEVQNILKKTDDVVDVDWMVEAPQTEFKLVPDNEKAMLNGIAPQTIGRKSYLFDGENIRFQLYMMKKVLNPSIW